MSNVAVLWAGTGAGTNRTAIERHLANIGEDFSLQWRRSAGTTFLARRFAALAAGGLCALLSGEALAFRTIADLPDYPDEQRVRWANSRFEFEVYETVPEWLSSEALAESSARAVQTWSEVACASLRTIYLGTSSTPAESGDGRNTVEMVTNGWEALGYRPDAAGATAVELAEDADGIWQIVEADIRINAEHHDWSFSDTPSNGQRSLLATLRHEAGHALGLLHPCEEDGSEGAPFCDELPSASEEAIMYPFYEPVQTELLEDDYAGICHLYPECEVSECGEGFSCTAEGCMLDCGDTQCTSDEYCVEGSCLSSAECELAGCFIETPEWLLVCDVTAECPDGLCLEDGSCAVACSRDDDCARGAACVFSEDPNVSGYCDTSPLKALGEACEESSQCADGECLAGARGQPLCTRTCGERERGCPRDWSCDDVEGRSVCVPPRAPRGCSVQAPPISSARANWWLVALPFVLIGWRKRGAARRQLSKGFCSTSWGAENGSE